jgi:glycine oxidase
MLEHLHGACRRSGVELRYGEGVAALAAGHLQTADGHRHACDEILLASGAWTPRLAALAGFDLPGTPVKGQLIRLDARLPLAGFVRAGRHYLVARSDGGVVVGATMTEEGFDRRPDPEVASELTRWAVATAPALQHAPLTACWTGLRPRLAGGLPVLGRVRPGLCVATGHFRNGVLLTPVTAERMTAVLGGNPLPFDAFRPVG